MSSPYKTEAHIRGGRVLPIEPATVRIMSGPFWMGSEGHYSWESPRHQVFLETFEIGRTSVTRSEYASFLSESDHPEPKSWLDPNLSDPQQPVVGVTWFDAAAYCEWLSIILDQTYRLPTEAEWEKACRGGALDLDYAWGDEAPQSFAYFQGRWLGPRQVGKWQPNNLGLFNMGDNVHEWCLDWYDPGYYAVSPMHNPTGPETGTRRVSRGGSWRHHVKAARCAHRSSLPPEYGYTDYGFRVVRADYIDWNQGQIQTW